MTTNLTESPLSAERRTLARRPCERHAILVVKHGLWSAQVRDITTHGLGIVAPHELGSHARFMIELFNPIDNFWYRKSLEVVHATPNGDNTWLLGSIFVQSFTLDDLRALLS